MMDHTRITMDENEVKILLLWLHAVSEITWTDVPTRERMKTFADRIYRDVIHSNPHLRKFLEDKNASLGDFT